MARNPNLKQLNVPITHQAANSIAEAGKQRRYSATKMIQFYGDAIRLGVIDLDSMIAEVILARKTSS